jgi:hypothetical protein
MIELKAQCSIPGNLEEHAISTFFFARTLNSAVFVYVSDGLGLITNMYLCNKIENELIDFLKDDSNFREK